MNKLQGFYRLRQGGLPAVPWQTFSPDTRLEEGILWTVRSAVERGDDQNLPRLVGAPAAEAAAFALDLLRELGPGGLVVYYPYFVAEKSGVIELSPFRTVIEAVRGDLWTLATGGEHDETVVITDEDVEVMGDEGFLSPAELDELAGCALRARRRFRGELTQASALYLEWSYARKSDLQKRPVGPAQLVFYELRAV